MKNGPKTCLETLGESKNYTNKNSFILLQAIVEFLCKKKKKKKKNACATHTSDELKCHGGVTTDHSTI